MNQESLESLSKLAQALALASTTQLTPAIVAAVEKLHQAERVYAELRAMGATEEEINHNVAMPIPQLYIATDLDRLEEDATEYLRRLEYTRRRYMIDGRMPLEQGKS
jgi:hypothetical protein